MSNADRRKLACLPDWLSVDAIQQFRLTTASTPLPAAFCAADQFVAHSGERSRFFFLAEIADARGGGLFPDNRTAE